MAEETTHPHKHIGHMLPEEAREHLRSAHHEMRQSWEGLFPPAFIEHHRNARKEMLMAWRSLIDKAIEHLEEHEKAA